MGGSKKKLHKASPSCWHGLPDDQICSQGRRVEALPGTWSGVISISLTFRLTASPSNLTPIARRKRLRDQTIVHDCTCDLTLLSNMADLLTSAHTQWLTSLPPPHLLMILLRPHVPIISGRKNQSCGRSPKKKHISFIFLSYCLSLSER